MKPYLKSMMESLERNTLLQKRKNQIHLCEWETNRTITPSKTNQ
jgi:hypothetical protein